MTPHPAPDWHPVQLERLRSMSGLERVLLASHLSADLLDMSRLGLRRLHPEWTERQVLRDFVRHLYGADLAERVYPDS